MVLPYRKRTMKVGDLVKHVFSERVGVAFNLAHDPLAMHNNMFDVAWINGEIGYNIWDYDLEIINEA